MVVRFVTTRAENLKALPIQNGTIIALSNSTGYFYDHNDQRYAVGGLNYVGTLPDPGTAGPGLYVLAASDAGNSPGIYIFQDGEQICLTEGAVDEAPPDNRYYVRQAGDRVEFHWTYSCSGTSADVGDINTILSEYSSSGRKYQLLKIVGPLSIGSTPISVRLRSGQRLVIDFTDAEVSATGSMFNVSNLSDGALILRGIRIQQALSTGILTLAASNLWTRIVDSSFVTNSASAEINITAGKLALHTCDFYMQRSKKTVAPVSIFTSDAVEIADCFFNNTTESSLTYKAVQMSSSATNVAIHNNKFYRCKPFDTAGELDVSMNNMYL